MATPAPGSILDKYRETAPKSRSKSLDLERAITDFWKFLDVIKFKGGVENFGDIHQDLSSFISSPQSHLVTPSIWKSGQISDQGRRRLVLVPRGHLKSTLCSVGYVLWRIYRNPNIRICVSTATKDLALSFVREVKQYLENEELQETVWNKRPHVPGRLIPILDKAGARRRDQIREALEYTEAEDKKIVWRADAIQVIRSTIGKEPTVLAASPGSNITGMHFDLIIKDDIVNDDTVATDAKIQKTLDWAHDIESILDPQRVVHLGKVGPRDYYEVIGDEDLVLGTRYAKGDYYDYILEANDVLGYEVFYRTVYKNGVRRKIENNRWHYDAGDNTEGYTWAARFNDKVVDNLKKRISVRRFAAQYLNQIITEEERVFSVDKIRTFHQDWVNVSNGWVEIHKPDTESVIIKPICVIDPAISDKKNADNTVIMVGGVDQNRNLYILDVAYGKFLPEKMIAEMFRLLDKWALYAVTVETVAYQAVIPSMIRSSFGRYRPIVVNPFKPQGEKKGRITSMLEPYFANEKLYVAQWIKLITQFREEVEYFPTPRVHDDFVDTMAMIAEIGVPTVRRRPGSDKVSTRLPVNTRWGGIY